MAPWHFCIIGHQQQLAILQFEWLAGIPLGNNSRAKKADRSHHITCGLYVLKWQMDVGMGRHQVKDPWISKCNWWWDVITTTLTHPRSTHSSTHPSPLPPSHHPSSPPHYNNALHTTQQEHPPNNNFICMQIFRKLCMRTLLWFYYDHVILCFLSILFLPFFFWMPLGLWHMAPLVNKTPWNTAVTSLGYRTFWSLDLLQLFYGMKRSVT